MENTIYEFIKETNIKNKYGKKLCLYKCKICNNEFLKRKVDIKNIKECHHKYKKHNVQGMSKTRIYKIYKGMINRCYNENNKNFKLYGGRNVKICDEWLNNFLNFYNWSLLNGYNETLTIDRINSKKNYEPNNCRWVSKKTNSSFTQKTKIIKINDEIGSCNYWSKRLNKSKNFISRMLKNKGINYTKEYIIKNL